MSNLEPISCHNIFSNDMIFVLWFADMVCKSKYLSHTSQDSERPDLGNARIVVTGGRALKSAENFKMIEKLAEKLGAAGCIGFLKFHNFIFKISSFFLQWFS